MIFLNVIQPLSLNDMNGPNRSCNFKGKNSQTDLVQVALYTTTQSIEETGMAILLGEYDIWDSSFHFPSLM